MNFVGVSTREKRNYDGVAREDKRVIYYGVCRKQSNQISLSALITTKVKFMEVFISMRFS